MTVIVKGHPRVTVQPPSAVWTLAGIEARRMLRHPAVWIGIGLTGWYGISAFRDVSWASAQYAGVMAASFGMLLGVSLASASSFGRELVSVSDDAPMGASARSAARLLGGLALVGLVAVVVAICAALMRLRGGMMLGDEPGRTLHAHYTLPELLQPVLLAGFAVALGAAAVHLTRNRIAASIGLLVVWFMAWGYWLFSAGPLPYMTLLQVQPGYIEVASEAAGPYGLPNGWLLEQPTEYQSSWVRLLVSPNVAAWHDVYLVGLTMLAVAVAVPGRSRQPLLLAGAAVAGGAVFMQWSVTPW